MRKIYIADEVVALAECIPEVAPALYACWRDPDTERGYNIKQTKSYAEYLAARKTNGWSGIILRRGDETPMGCVMIFPEIAQPDLAIMVYPGYRGKGYGTRAFALGAQYCAETFGLERIYAGCYPDNHASLKMLERCGFVPDPEPVGGLETHYITGEEIVQLEFVKYLC
ncbi:MAG: GNAT family N-acetyltransferase [Oscillospiraceae bacterium]|jgi:RimJ/RimL family protein N-acetyltransferase|nr:GNAT family N-acetyltransferase [Oscillospiraceae bacterium]